MAASTNLTPEQRRQRARVAALARWSKEDPTANARRAQAGLLDKFRREITAEQPDVTEPELTRRAEARRRQHMARMSFAASKKRSERKRSEPKPKPKPRPVTVEPVESVADMIIDLVTTGVGSDVLVEARSELLEALTVIAAIGDEGDE